MRPINWLSLLLTLVLASEVYADDAALEIIAGISTPRDTPVAFAETRMTPLFAEPMQVQGEVEFSSAGVLSKRITEPFSELISISADEVVLQRDDQQRSFKIESADNLASLYEGLRSILDGDAAMVRDFYEIEMLAGAPDWHLRLTPRQQQGGSLIPTFVIQGTNQQIRFIRTEIGADNWQETTLEVAATPAQDSAQQ